MIFYAFGICIRLHTPSCPVSLGLRVAVLEGRNETRGRTEHYHLQLGSDMSEAYNSP